jgi:glycosyltransferase involved in cell wall biosynthesis
VPRREVVSAIEEADLIVSTSRWEANSVVLLESMAAGTAWVSTDVGSARENAGGIVAGSPKQMADAAAQLLLDGSQRKELGAEGLARARERHDWKRITDEYEQLYQDVIGRRSNAGEVIAPSAVPVYAAMPVR